MIGLLASLRRRHSLVRDGGERGTSLIELIVGMSIMTVCGAIFLGSAVTLSRVTAKTQAVTTTASQTNLAYLALDRTLRYASYVTEPGKSTSGNWYVEFRDTTTGSEVCTQLRIDNSTKQLQRRTWSTTTTPVTPTAFRQISTGFTNGTVAKNDKDQPFLLLPETETSTVSHQRLVVTLLSASGSSGAASASRSSFMLTALNSTGTMTTGSICQQAGRP